MNQLDREFITTTIEKNNTSLKGELLNAIKTSEKELKIFIVEHVSEEINGLAYTVAKSFEKMDKKFEEKFDGINARLDGVNRRIDKIDLNMVKIEDFARLEKRVTKLEKVAT